MSLAKSKGIIKRGKLCSQYNTGILNLVDRQPRQTKQCCVLANQNQEKQTKIGTVNRSLKRVLGNCIGLVKFYKTKFSSAMVYPNSVLRISDCMVNGVTHHC
jgi:hypothetical protein